MADIKVVVTDPIDDDKFREEGDFTTKWAEIGELMLEGMTNISDGPGTVWINVNLSNGDKSYLLNRTIGL